LKIQRAATGEKHQIHIFLKNKLLKLDKNRKFRKKLLLDENLRFMDELKKNHLSKKMHFFFANTKKIQDFFMERSTFYGK
jgi:hypothetical protein